MVWLLLSSLRPDDELFRDPLGLPRLGALAWRNFGSAWTQGRFGEHFATSAVVTVATVVLTVLLGAMAAYALSRFVFPGVRATYFYFLGGLMVPLQLAVVPLFFQMRALSLYGSRTGLVLVYVAWGLPFAVFVLTGFFRGLPRSLHEAALLDGAGEVRAFVHVMLPLARPGLVAVGIFTFLGTWNEFFLAFMLLSGRGAARTLALGVADVTIASQYRTDFGMAFAGLVLLMLPTLIVYVLLQRHLVKGVTLGALKG
jgi:ABC-type glycerol-3-phosphate transport system permease component